MTSCVTRSRERTVLFLATPALWPAWPFLPVVRRSRGREELGRTGWGAQDHQVGTGVGGDQQLVAQPGQPVLGGPGLLGGLG